MAALALVALVAPPPAEEEPADVEVRERGRPCGDHGAIETRESGGERPRLVAEVALERRWAQIVGVQGPEGRVAGAVVRPDSARGDDRRAGPAREPSFA